jgi:hypothetical protein
MALTVTAAATPSETGPKELPCGLRIPSVWFADRSDGLLGLRDFRAVLHALRCDWIMQPSA